MGSSNLVLGGPRIHSNSIKFSHEKCNFQTVHVHSQKVTLVDLVQVYLQRKLLVIVLVRGPPTNQRDELTHQVQQSGLYTSISNRRRSWTLRDISSATH